MSMTASVDLLMALEREPSLELAGAMAAGEPATATAELPVDGLLSYCKMLCACYGCGRSLLRRHGVTQCCCGMVGSLCF
jgi:hypothetical protein